MSHIHCLLTRLHPWYQFSTFKLDDPNLPTVIAPCRLWLGLEGNIGTTTGKHKTTWSNREKKMTATCWEAEIQVK